MTDPISDAGPAGLDYVKEQEAKERRLKIGERRIEAFDKQAVRALKVVAAIGERTGQGSIPCDCGGTIRWVRRGSRAMQAACNSCDFQMMA